MQPRLQRQSRFSVGVAHSLYRPSVATYVWSGLNWTRSPHRAVRRPPARLARRRRTQPPPGDAPRAATRRHRPDDLPDPPGPATRPALPADRRRPAGPAAVPRTALDVDRAGRG